METRTWITGWIYVIVGCLAMADSINGWENQWQDYLFFAAYFIAAYSGHNKISKTTL